MNPLLAFSNPAEFSIWNSHPELVIGFAITVVIMLALDLGVFNKKSHVVSSKEALIWSAVWISLAMIFSGVVYYLFEHKEGHQFAVEAFSQFQAAYWIEKALSVDNLFVFILVFTAFKVPKALHHKVLFWGIIGALIFRAIFIFAGVGIINATYLPAMNIFGQEVEINIVLAIFGFFLLYSGITSWGAHKDEDENEEKDFSNNMAVKLVNKMYSVSKTYDGDKFFTIQNGIKMATPLFVAVVVIEFTDLIFAVDSIPAIFAISRDPFILYTSNIFAILGLRSLYFLLANFMHMFSKLPYGLAIVLAFIGVKMIIMPWIHFPSTVSLGIVGGILLLSVIASLIWPGEKHEVKEIEEEANQSLQDQEKH